MVGVLLAVLLGLFLLLLSVCAACGAIWFVGPSRIRPPWLDWGLDQPKENKDEDKDAQPSDET